MTLTLKCPDDLAGDPERILTMGVQGTGKSVAILTIARLIPNVSFRVLDIDYTPGMSRLQRLMFPELTNVKVESIDPEDFPAQVEAFDWLVKETEPDDWAAIDSMSHTWQAVQSYFVDQIHGREIDEYFMYVRKRQEDSRSNKKEQPIKGWDDWPAINKTYFRKVYGKITRISGHVYLTAEQQSVSDEDDKGVKGLFGPYGVRPVGQKRLGFIPNTVLLLTKSRAGEYNLSTIKDRGRAEVEEKRIADFGKDYLMSIAGWRRKPA